jgi:TPR repeat protein
MQKPTSLLSQVATVVGCLAIAPVMVLATPSPSHAGPLEDGVEAVQIHEFDEALRLLRPLAEGGNAVAQFNLGFLYQYGHGVPQNNTDAANWYRRSSQQGFGEGQLGLGFSPLQGAGRAA